MNGANGVNSPHCDRSMGTQCRSTRFDIHFLWPIWGWVAEAVASAGKLRLPSPQPRLPTHPTAFPGQVGDIASPMCPGSTSWPPASVTCLAHISREMSRKHPNQMPEPLYLAPLNVEEFLPRQAQSTLWPRLRLVASTTEPRNMVHSDSMCPA